MYLFGPPPTRKTAGIAMALCRKRYRAERRAKAGLRGIGMHHETLQRACTCKVSAEKYSTAKRAPVLPCLEPAAVDCEVQGIPEVVRFIAVLNNVENRAENPRDEEESQERPNARGRHRPPSLSGRRNSIRLRRRFSPRRCSLRGVRRCLNQKMASCGGSEQRTFCAAGTPRFFIGLFPLHDAGTLGRGAFGR